MGERLGRWALREELASRHHAVKIEQLSAFLGWGLLDEFEANEWPVVVREPRTTLGLAIKMWQPPSPPVNWPLGTVERVIQICDASVEERSLPRRVVLLRMRREFSFLRAEPLGKAMITTLGTISRPVHQMQRVDLAMRHVGARLAAAIPMPRELMLPRSWRAPEPAEWKRTLEETPIDLFRSRIDLAYYMAASYLPAEAKENPMCDLADMRLVDKVTLLAVRDFYAWHILRNTSPESE
jgi:hypothetical protein